MERKLAPKERSGMSIWEENDKVEVGTLSDVFFKLAT
jgi:hypothetical protein